MTLGYKESRGHPPVRRATEYYISTCKANWAEAFSEAPASNTETRRFPGAFNRFGNSGVSGLGGQALACAELQLRR